MKTSLPFLVLFLLLPLSSFAEESSPKENPQGETKENPDKKVEEKESTDKDSTDQKAEEGKTDDQKTDEAKADDKVPSTPCDEDASKLCKDAGGSTNSCLANARDQISEGCKKFRADMNNAFEHQAIKRVCRDDSLTYCQVSKGDKSRIKDCLKKNVEKLSPECQAEVGK